MFENTKRIEYEQVIIDKLMRLICNAGEVALSKNRKKRVNSNKIWLQILATIYFRVKKDVLFLMHHVIIYINKKRVVHISTFPVKDN